MILGLHQFLLRTNAENLFDIGVDGLDQSWQLVDRSWICFYWIDHVDHGSKLITSSTPEADVALSGGGGYAHLVHVWLLLPYLQNFVII